jgi:hypothetical protein
MVSRIHCDGWLLSVQTRTSEIPQPRAGPRPANPCRSVHQPYSAKAL